MTKSFEKLSMESLHGLDYSASTPPQKPVDEPCEPPVLDLSCKKSMPPSPPSDHEKEPMISPISSTSPLRGSPYLENHRENNNNNNNDSKHMHNYQHPQPSPKQTEMEQTQQTLTHHYHHDESTAFTSNHERKSPLNRAYIMTPPSESDSPKKTRFQPIYDHSNGLMQAHPAYSMIPMNMNPISLPVPMPMSIPQVLPAMLSQVNNHVPVPVPSMQIPTPPSPHDVQPMNVSSEESKKAPRPFKAYPKDALSLTLSPNMLFDQELKEKYSDFRNKMLDCVKRTNEGTNIKMRRMSKSPMLPTSTCSDKDEAYWERRRKNNEAAKRSRDARRAKEDEIAIKAAFLEAEYNKLKYENAILKAENSKLLYGR
ncbi:hypothetical protein TSAR_007242 [Trichomalopsis sarcophagae]|uniref:BZIP domain-containing protein n=1 Tax=Trichomalopsis sarcophagae TaxID=543379 RepID=A0A232F1J7_9HYME|nr:hypothetical protein TSAR_007242 [Trichomalopsis sarcophagae]